METGSYLKAQDRSVAPAGGPTETADLEATWLRTDDPPARGMARAVIEGTGGGLRVRVFETIGPANVDWGWTPVDALYAASPHARTGVGFTAVCKPASRVVHLHANLSKGLLIIATMTAADQQGGRHGEFARDFFRKVDESQSLPPPGCRPEPSSRPPAPAADSASAFLGTWRNTNARTASLSKVSFAGGGEDLVLHAFGTGDGTLIDWGPTQAGVFVGQDAATGSAKIMAAYDFGFMEVLMHAWVKQGVLVIAIFNRFKDQSGRSNYFDREFFYREDFRPNAAT
jgi:hypothetical protein